MNQRMQAAKNGANVRMYRQGLGDAFLLAFDKGAGDVDDPVYVLIDCGVILGTPDPKTPLTAVIENILAATKNHIDLLIISHEHWDHVGSFQQLPDLWKQLTVDAVWMAWTEDPNDKLGVQLKQQFKNDLDALCLAVKAAKQSETPLTALTSFFGEPDDILRADINGETRLGMDELAFGSSTHVGMQNARSLTTPEAVKYLSPGTTLPLPNTLAGAVHVYTLGPPRDAALLRDINPCKRDPETYSNPAPVVSDAPALARNEKSAFTLALKSRSGTGFLPMTEDEEYVAGICLPFEAYQGVDWPKGENEEHSMYANYWSENEKWRRIDHDWLGVAGELALQMDSYTNNTSLVLAFELANGEVLLFPADAQVGNWMSWDHIAPPLQNARGETVTIKSLLSRTKLLKVGHHGSHNATMRTMGLERMPDSGLVALLPVDEEVAHEKKHWNEMPFGPMLARLYAKTGGQVIRADQGVVTEQKPAFLSDADWTTIQSNAKKFKAAVRSQESDGSVKADSTGGKPLFYEVSIPLG